MRHGKPAEALWGNKDAAEGAAGAIGKTSDAVEGESEALKAYGQMAAEAEQMKKDFAEREEERAAQQVKQREELKRSTLELVEKYKDLTKGEWELLDAITKAEIIEARRLANKEGWIDASGKTLSAMDKEAKALEKDEQLRKEAAKALFEQTQQTLDFQLVLEQIRSDERLQIIELKFNLELEELRQQGETARAIIDSINQTIASTGETLSDLAGNLGGFSSTSSSGYREMMEIIEDESRRRDEAIAMQRKITDAQAELMDAQADAIRARTEAFDRGDAAIQIDGAGLQPHLEAFMWEILQSIQTRVNAEGYDMLLGYEGGTN